MQLNEGTNYRLQISIVLYQAKLSSKKVVLWLDKGSKRFPFFFCQKSDTEFSINLIMIQHLLWSSTFHRKLSATHRIL